MEQPSSSLLILGASARAAAQSALRAGFAPLARDLFADVDLQRACPTATRVDRYPLGLAPAAARHPAAPWLYTGGLENHPDLVEEIARHRPLLGVDGDALRAVRDPFRVAAALTKHGLSFPRCERIETLAPAGGRWLIKRRASAGGAGVRLWQGELPQKATAGDYYLQERVAGRACSAVYIAAAGRSALLGITEQLIAAAWCGGRGFQYCGSIGPLRRSRDTLDRFRRIGECLAGEFSLAGLFGVDAIVNRRGVWPVEVNPRYTASVEVLERALGIPAIGWHVEACRNGCLPDEHHGPTSRRKVAWCGKAILFACHDIVIDGRMSDLLVARLDESIGRTLIDGRIENPPYRDFLQYPWPSIADIPGTGSRIAAHRPIMTVLAAGDTRERVLERLQAASVDWNAALGMRNDHQERDFPAFHTAGHAGAPIEPNRPRGYDSKKNG